MANSISRRQFGVATCAATAPILSTKFSFPQEQKLSKALRVIAYNIYGGKGWPQERPLARQAVAKKQMAKRLALELELYAPDIICFSESPSEAITREIAQLLGFNHVRFPSGGSWPGTLLSRFEITQSQNAPLGFQRPPKLFTRHWGRAELLMPDQETLIVHSAHLFPTADPVNRLAEIREMVKSMQADLQSGKSMLLIGDLNHEPDTAEYKLWMEAGWIDTFAKIGVGEGPTIKADVPERRIDYVMAAGKIANQIVESRPLFEGGFRLNLEDPQSFALSDHLPQLAVFDLSK
jgi:endonuclease/exonuclease/phosphatase family metal-dependent hydrolase